MKKFFKVFGLATLFALVAISCRKAPEIQHSSSSENVSTQRSASNGILIQAIKGQIPEYIGISELEELLLDNVPLNNGVLIQTIKTERLPDDLVEMLVILSTPVNQAIMNNLAVHRSSIDIASILKAQNTPHGSEFVVVNTDKRTLIIADVIELQHSRRDGESEEECDCG